jgi:hypothetical protein
VPRDGIAARVAQMPSQEAQTLLEFARDLGAKGARRGVSGRSIMFGTEHVDAVIQALEARSREHEAPLAVRTLQGKKNSHDRTPRAGRGLF